jgi:chromosome segregation protein
MANKLLSLELHGYKTFASKTDFNFPGQITAVVGPNGSGKSNIADSIRWVLGEQAYSLLRGKKTIDMIFSGSEQRPRASMASVSITFDNQDGWLPVDFSEVTITRRAYRSGENEYLLNNQRVRLKEINELLANSGLGERTYTIIGQGLVDTALSLKPEERRRFFEEASGIGLYKSRREEATQKLDKTLHNMERVNDILKELHPRLSYLEKSKEKAKQYQQVQNDLNLLLKDWYGYHWHSVQKELKYAVDFNSKQNEQLNARRGEKQELEARVNKTQAGLNEKRERLANWHLELSKLHSTKEDATREIAVRDERERSLRDRSQELEAAILVLNDEITQHEAELETLKQDGEKVQKELAKAVEALNGANSKLDERRTERVRIEKQVDDLQKQIIANESEILKTESRIDYINHQAENDRNELQILNSNQAGVNEFIKQSEKKIAEIQSEVARLQTEVAGHQKSLEMKRKQRAEVRDRIDSLERKYREVDLAISKLEAELKVMREAEESLAGFTTGSKEFIQAVKGNKVRAKFALLLDYLKVPQEYELAFSAALGELLEGIILEEGTSTEEILDYLDKSKTSRTVFLPGWWKVNTDQKQFSSTAKRASELVNDTSDYARLIKGILSTTYIVDNAREADKLVQELPLGMKVVTTKGEVFDTRGTITAGNEFRVKNLSRKREKEVTEKDIETFRGEAQSLQKELEDQKNNLNRLNEEIHQLSDLEQQNQKKIQQLGIDSHKAEIEKNQKQDQMGDISKRLEQINIAFENRSKENASLKNSLKDLKNQLAEKQKLLDEGFKGINDLPIEEIRSTVMELTSDKAVIEQLANQHNNRTKEKEKALQETQGKVGTQRSRLAEMTQTLQTIVAEKKQLVETDTRVSSEIDSLSEKIKPLEEEVESGIKHQGSLLEDVDASRNQYSIAERHALQAQMKVDKLRDRMEELRKKIQEDFGLLPEENEEGLIGPKPLPIDGMIAMLPEIEILPENLDEQIKQQKSYLRRLGPVNPDAEVEYDEVCERVGFLTEQLQDLEKAEKDLRQVVSELDELMKKEFLKTFRKVEEEFKIIFGQLFTGGSARIFIEDEENIMESGIEIEATLPGKRKQELGLLSGGERSLTAVALIFALLKISPTPFCIMDEVDAMLDESNVMRFGELLRELSETTQFIVITHNRNTVQLADVLYGVTMGKDTVSQVISLRMDELTEEMVQ